MFKGKLFDQGGLAEVVDVRLTALQLALAAARLPLRVHLAFNAAAAAGMWMLGHPMLAAWLFVGASTFDAAQQTILRHWQATTDKVTEAQGMRRLAVLGAARISVYSAPTFTMALGGGSAELVFYAVQLATLLVITLGGGALSRAVFWGYFSPILAELLALAVTRFDLVSGAAIFLNLVILLLIASRISRGTVRTISSWHGAFMDSVALSDDLAVARDQAVAERAAADEAREAARAATRSKANFLATMSHEIRTPMNGVLGMAQLLRRDETDPAQVQRLDVLIDSGEYLLAILNDILDVSKIDAGRLEIVSAHEPLRPFFDSVIAFWAPRAREQGLALTLDVADGAPEAVLMDSLRLRQVLFNLVGNALKFTDAGTVAVSVSATPDGDGRVMLDMAVSDTGVGIAHDQLPRLFDRFSQVDDSEVRRFGGTGLGLAIAKQLTELMGGRIWAESAPGLGSAFHIRLPLQISNVAPAPADKPAVESSDDAAPLRVLAVDDNAVNLMVLDQLLSVLGHNIAKAGSGPEALTMLSTEPFDLVLLDIQMPGMSGVEVLERLRREAGPNAAVPVVALTADVTSGGRKRYLDVGFTDHCTKPIQVDELMAALVRAMSADPRATQAA